MRELTKGQRDLLAWLCEEQAVSRDAALLMKDKHRLPASALVRKGYVRMDLCRAFCRNMLWLTQAGLRACEALSAESGKGSEIPPAVPKPPSRQQM